MKRKRFTEEQVIFAVRQTGDLGASFVGGHGFRISIRVHGGIPAVVTLFARPVWGCLCREIVCCTSISRTKLILWRAARVLKIFSDLPFC
jgi:hypothetical protein